MRKMVYINIHTHRVAPTGGLLKCEKNVYINIYTHRAAPADGLLDAKTIKFYQNQTSSYHLKLSAIISGSGSLEGPKNLYANV